MSACVVVGPFPIYFGNVNEAMGLPGHYHTAAVTLEYGYSYGTHGYPSFKETNDAIRERLRVQTARIFRDATNEDVAQRLWAAFAKWTAPEWQRWGGRYWLAALHLDVEGVDDAIGHDPSTTRYSLRRGEDDVPSSEVLPLAEAVA